MRIHRSNMRINDSTIQADGLSAAIGKVIKSLMAKLGLVTYDVIPLVTRVTEKFDVVQRPSPRPYGDIGLWKGF